MTPSNTILVRAAKCFVSARQGLIEGASLLHEISTKGLWKGEYGSFGEYLERECQISQSFAAKLIKVYDTYAIQGQVSPEKLKEIDSEKLYLAIGLPGSAGDRLARAETLSRSELKAELASDENGDCQHESIINICAACHARV
jgi:hypothetical protein